MTLLELIGTGGRCFSMTHHERAVPKLGRPENVTDSQAVHSPNVGAASGLLHDAP